MDCGLIIRRIAGVTHALHPYQLKQPDVRTLEFVKAELAIQGERWALCGGRVQDQTSQPVTLTCPCDELARQCRGYASPAPFGGDSQPANFANVPRVDPCRGGGQTTEVRSVDRS